MLHCVSPALKNEEASASVESPPMRGDERCEMVRSWWKKGRMRYRNRGELDPLSLRGFRVLMQPPRGP